MEIVKQAIKVMEQNFKGGDWLLNSSEKAKDFARLKIGASKDEVFAVLFLDNQLKNLDFTIFFYGTINECTIHLRPIVRRALDLNAANIILMHNHPSGDCTPSEADIRLTGVFKTFFRQLDVNVIDHLVVSPVDVISLKERGHI